MRKILARLAVCLAVGARLHAVDPVVSDVLAQQRSGTELVDITYAVADPDSATLTVTIAISSDGGTTWTVPCTSVTGNGIGAAVTPGTGKTIVWNAGADWNGQWSEHMRVRVTADDAGGGPPPGDEFAPIPAGSNSGTNPLGAGELPNPVFFPETYSLTVSAFYMGRCEVTKAKWDEVRAAAAAHGYIDLPAGGGKRANHPVQWVNWYDVVKWCNARSEIEGRPPCYLVSGVVYRTGQRDDVVCNTSAPGYRLPTDVEWEYAARGGLSSARFPWGDIIDHTRANYPGYPSGYSYDQGYPGYDTQYNDGVIPYTSPVGSFPANGYGLYDMVGNVWEWCWDWYPGWPPEDRVMRGGAFDVGAFPSCVGFRSCYWPSDSNMDMGFRLALSAGQK